MAEVWRPLLDSGVVSGRIISTCFLGAISLQGEVSNGLCQHLQACKQGVYFCEHEQ